MGNFEERFLSDNKMGAYQTLLLLVLLTWTPQQSICKPHHGGPHTTDHPATENHGTENHGTAEHHGGPHNETTTSHGGPHEEATTSMPDCCPELRGVLSFVERSVPSS